MHESGACSVEGERTVTVRHFIPRAALVWKDLVPTEPLG